MNERVNELIKSIPDLRYDASTGQFETDRRALYDLVELIVRECADVGALGQSCTDSDLIKRGVLAHFGVE